MIKLYRDGKKRSSRVTLVDCSYPKPNLEVVVNTGDNAQVNIELEPSEGSHIFTLTISPEAFEEIIKKYQAKKDKIKKPRYREIPVVKNQANKIYNVVKAYQDNYGHKMRIREESNGNYRIELKISGEGQFKYLTMAKTLDAAIKVVTDIKDLEA